MATPFALAYAQPRTAKPATPFRYDPTTQLNLLPDNTPVAENWPVLLTSAATTSTAGNATHNDD